jgi:hypothetical protein
MKCPNCGSEFKNPIAGPEKLQCPKCGEDLVRLDLLLAQGELEAFNEVISLAMTDAEFYNELREDPYEVLEDKGISRETISYLTEVLDEIGVPVVPASIADPSTWPDFELPEEDSLA